ncbi:MAG: rhamnan synthesis F family protein [Pseudomonadota bacterium]
MSGDDRAFYLDLLRSCEDLDWADYSRCFDLPVGVDPVEHYLDNWESISPVFAGFFDTAFYLSSYPGIKRNRVIPLVHFLKHGIAEGRAGWPEEQAPVVEPPSVAHGVDERIDPKFEYLYQALSSQLALDWAGYAERYALPEGGDPIEHYLVNWEAVAPVFNGFFDTKHYFSEYPDITVENLRESGLNPLAHFLLFGIKEGRLGWGGEVEAPSRKQEESLAEKKEATLSEKVVRAAGWEAALRTCHQLDWDSYVSHFGLADGEDPVFHYIENWDSQDYVFEGFFDPAYYVETYRDLKIEQLRAAGMSPLAHYVQFGIYEGRLGWPVASSGSDFPEDLGANVAHFYQLLKSNPNLDWKQYSIQLGLDDSVDPVLHYINNWKSVAPVFEGFFDQKIYYELYPDLRGLDINPLVHFVEHGVKEGRKGWISLSAFSQAGGVSFVEGRRTILVVTHETSATGAPVVALEVARRLGERFNVITLSVSMRKDRLHEAFVQASVLHLEGVGAHGPTQARLVVEQLLLQYPIYGVILNSVETFNVMQAMAHFGAPSVSLIHEYAEYTRPFAKMGFALLSSDVVVYPAESLRRSGFRDLKHKIGIKHAPNHVWVQPQGSMQFGAKVQDHGASEHILRRRFGIPVNAILIAGAGHVQPRKGVDWFAETAYYITRRMHEEAHPLAGDVHFVWLGGGYDLNDLDVSVWLETYIENAGLKKRLHFAGHVSSVSEALSDADIYLLTSRLDPFPNVAIDAMVADCGIGCFAEASGVADFLQTHASRSVIAPYGDCAGLAGQVVERLEWLVERDGVNRKLAEDELCFEHYLSVIEQALDEAVRRQSALSSAMERVEKEGACFNGDFYRVGFESGNPLRHFLSLLQKGVVYKKPYPGSAIQGFLDHQPYGDEKDEPFDIYAMRALQARSEDVAGTVVSIVPDGAFSPKLFDGVIAIQFHVYYNDLIAEYADYFACLLEYPVDLYVSHVHPLEEAELESLRSAVSGEVFTLRVGNEGRDVYPFHRLYVESIAGRYDVVGHFHTKKSKDSGERLGDRWRRYLLSNLIGSKPAASQILAQFNAPEVGLVYAEDRHCVDEADNGEYIQELLEQMGLKAQPPYYHFPLGTMFWARTEALAALKALDLDVFRLPEPIPYDGSVLHAFERIVPQLIVSAGYKPRRVYTDKTFW